MFAEIDFALIRDVTIIVIPILLVLGFILKFIVPKKPLLGIGLVVGGGLLGSWLINRRLRSAQDAEERLATHNKMMAAFKDKQDQRAEAVLVNKKIIDTLEAQRAKLAEKQEKHRDELKLIDAELSDRQKLNKDILSDSGDFLNTVAKRSRGRKNILDRFITEGESLSGDAPVSEPDGNSTQIEINGHRLIEV